MQHRNIVIAGGGPIGLTMALLLAKSGQAITLFDIGNSKQNDGRVLALSHASVELLREYNAWPDSLGTAINQVHISHDGLGVSKICATDVELEHLGYTVKYADICATLKDEVNRHNSCKFITAAVGAVTPGANYATISYLLNGKEECMAADLVILAEGGNIKIENAEYENYDYSQTAIIAKLNTQKKHDSIAYERFENDSSLVLLPYGSQYIIVWSLENVVAGEMIANSEILNEKLMAMPFMTRFGEFKIDGAIHSFPLKLQYVKNRVLDKVVLIGNSAQTVHPVSAQGMNLGLRDARILSEILADLSTKSGTFKVNRESEDAGQSVFASSEAGIQRLSLYNDLRKKDAKNVIKFTNALAKLPDLNIPFLKHIRGAGIMALSNCTQIQNKIANSLIFGN